MKGGGTKLKEDEVEIRGKVVSGWRRNILGGGRKGGKVKGGERGVDEERSESGKGVGVEEGGVEVLDSKQE